jgi:Ser/Thr protein kinase RdoA (MazF antagonist)
VQPRIATLPRLWTHNDWHVSNLCWTGTGPEAEVATVLDFGLAAPTFALYDLATAIERNAIAWLELDRGMDAAYPQTAHALIDGYAEVLPLAPDQRALLADLLRVVHIDFALSEVEYYHGIVHSLANADAAWVTFLLGHAAWFDTPPGGALLAAVCGRA